MAIPLLSTVSVGQAEDHNAAFFIENGIEELDGENFHDSKGNLLPKKRPLKNYTSSVKVVAGAGFVQDPTITRHV